jgi:hypothetical protein
MKECKARIASLALNGPIRVACSDLTECLRRRIAEGESKVREGEVFEGDCVTEEGPQGQRSSLERQMLAKAEQEISHI